MAIPFLRIVKNTSGDEDQLENGCGDFWVIILQERFTDSVVCVLRSALHCTIDFVKSRHTGLTQEQNDDNLGKHNGIVMNGTNFKNHFGFLTERFLPPILSR